MKPHKKKRRRWPRKATKANTEFRAADVTTTAHCVPMAPCVTHAYSAARSDDDAPSISAPDRGEPGRPLAV